MVFKDYDKFMKLSGVYKVECIVTHISYIGATGGEFRYRFQGHKSSLKRNCHDCKRLQLDYNLYGEDNFVFEVLEVETDINKIKQLEDRYIQLFSTTSGVYNKEKGGKGIGIYATSETKQKMSESHKGHKLSQQHKDILNEYNKNKTLTKEQKEHLSKMFQGSKSCLAVLDEKKVYEIKTLLVQGKPVSEIAKLYNVKDSCINNIRMEYRWKHVVVDGWQDFVNNKIKRRHTITPEQELEIVEKIKLGINNWTIHLQYSVSYDKIKNIKNRYNL